MNQKTLQKLEFHKIIDLLTANASSERGKLLCRTLKPMTELGPIETAQEQTAAAFTRIVQNGHLSFSDVLPTEASLKRLEIGASLSAEELLRIAGTLRTAARAVSYGHRDTTEEEADCLDSYFQQSLFLSYTRRSTNAF